LAAWPSAFKETSCPYCKKEYSRPRSTREHLDAFIRPKKPRAEDGVHDLDEIRRLSEGHVATVRAVLARVHDPSHQDCALDSSPQPTPLSSIPIKKARCPFCMYVFKGRYELKRHLAGILQTGAFRAPDGVHDMEEVRKMMRGEGAASSSALREGSREPCQQREGDLDEDARPSERDGMRESGHGLPVESSQAELASTEDLPQRPQEDDSGTRDQDLYCLQ